MKDIDKLLRIQFSEIFIIFSFKIAAQDTVCKWYATLLAMLKYYSFTLHGQHVLNFVMGLEPHAPVTQRWPTLSDYGKAMNHVMKLVYGINIREQVVKKR